MNEPKSPKSQLGRGPRFEPAVLDVLLVACAVLTLWFILPLLDMAWVSDTSQPQTPSAAAQSLESKVRVPSEPESARPNSLQPIVVTENEINAYLKSKPIALPDHVIRVESDNGEATFVRSPEKKT